MTQRIYISGPISGKPGGNTVAFAAAAVLISSAGHRAVNPHDNGKPKDAPWGEHMRADIRMLMDCDAIAMLPGWRQSKGAALEHHIAQQLGMTVFELLP